MTDNDWAALNKRERDVALRWARMSMNERSELMEQIEALLTVAHLMGQPFPRTRAIGQNDRRPEPA